MRDDAGDRLGSDGEHDLQERFGTKARALAFYDGSMHDRLNAVMTAFVRERIMFFSRPPIARATPTARPGSVPVDS